MPRELIINADDLGQTDAITDGILRAAAGAVTSATLLCNGGSAAERAVRLARELPNLGVGVHLNLTHGHALASPQDVPLLARTDGSFRHGPVGLLSRSWTNREFRRQVRAEWACQIQWAMAQGLRPTHLDSHKHVHTAPALFRIACELAREYSVPCVRRVSEPMWRCPLAKAYPPLGRLRHVKQWTNSQALRLLGAGSARRTLNRNGLRSADRFYGVADTGGWSGPLLCQLLERLPEGVSELMVHPGEPSAPAEPGRLAQSRPLELESLLAVDLPALARRLSIRLTHYGQLAPPAKSPAI